MKSAAICLVVPSRQIIHGIGNAEATHGGGLIVLYSEVSGTGAQQAYAMSPKTEGGLEVGP